MSNEPIKLAACPFCGGDDVFIEPDERGSGGQHVPPYHVGCKACKAEQMADTEDEAIAAWNRRPTPPEAQAGAGMELTNNDAIGHIDEKGRVFIYSDAPKGVLLFTAAPKAVAQGWIKIEEDAEVDVPLDTVVLLAWWDEWSEEWKIEANYAGSERGGWRHGRATHWQPLPASPSEEEKA